MICRNTLFKHVLKELQSHFLATLQIHSFDSLFWISPPFSVHWLKPHPMTHTWTSALRTCTAGFTVSTWSHDKCQRSQIPPRRLTFMHSSAFVRRERGILKMRPSTLNNGGLETLSGPKAGKLSNLVACLCSVSVRQNLSFNKYIYFLSSLMHSYII